MVIKNPTSMICEPSSNPIIAVGNLDEMKKMYIDYGDHETNGLSLMSIKEASIFCSHPGSLKTDSRV